MKKGRYYLARVNKTNLDQQKLMDALVDSPIKTIGKFNWTIADVIDSRTSSIPFIFGFLVKYASEGQVKIVKEASKSQIKAIAENLIEASAPFIYLPEYSAIAYLHVWNDIPEQTFRKRVASLVKEYYRDMILIDCNIEPIADYTAFISKLRRINTFVEISANVQPPNPMFGRLWKNLKEYVEKRNASNVIVKETSQSKKGLNTNVIKLVVNIDKDPEYKPDFNIDIREPLKTWHEASVSLT